LRLLVVYYMPGHLKWLPAYRHNVFSFREYSGAQCLYFNAARSSVPRYVSGFKPDLVVFHYTLLNMRLVPDEFRRACELVRFTKAFTAPKALVAQDEQVRMDLLNEFVNEFGVSHVFTPAPPSTWRRVYAEVDPSGVTFHPILNGYIDENEARRIARRLPRHRDRSVDIGYRSWYTQHYYGQHAAMKQEIGRVFARKAPGYGLRIDISGDEKDALWGDRWFDFLLDCKYTLGVEGGCSVFDWDGAIAARTRDYMSEHPKAGFDEVRDACFSGLDGEFEFFSLSPRHLEAVMTKTCQVLVEGEYGGVLVPGLHYIELKRDFSNLDQVLERIKEDDLREAMVERAYADIVESGRYTYRSFVENVIGVCKRPSADHSERPRERRRTVGTWNMIDEAGWRLRGRAWMMVRRADDRLRHGLRPVVSRILGERRLETLLRSVRRAGSDSTPRDPDDSSNQR